MKRLRLFLITPTCLVIALIALSLGPIRSAIGEEFSKSAATATSLNDTSKASTMVRVLLEADGTTDEDLVAGYLESIRAMGAGGAAPVADELAALLKESSPLYRDRDKHEVQRLRGYVLVVLSDVGIPKSALPHIVDWLANSDDRMGYQFGTAARAVGSLGPAGRPLVPYVLAGMQRYYHRDEFSLKRYDPDYSRAEATTVQLEGVRALGRISDHADPDVLELLRSYASGEHPDTRRYPKLLQQASDSLKALAESKNPNNVPTDESVNQ